MGRREEAIVQPCRNIYRPQNVFGSVRREPVHRGRNQRLRKTLRQLRTGQIHFEESDVPQFWIAWGNVAADSSDDVIAEFGQIEFRAESRRQTEIEQSLPM